MTSSDNGTGGGGGGGGGGGVRKMGTFARGGGRPALSCVDLRYLVTNCIIKQ